MKICYWKRWKKKDNFQVQSACACQAFFLPCTSIASKSFIFFIVLMIKFELGTFRARRTWNGAFENCLICIWTCLRIFNKCVIFWTQNICAIFQENEVMVTSVRIHLKRVRVSSGSISVSRQTTQHACDLLAVGVFGGICRRPVPVYANGSGTEAGFGCVWFIWILNFWKRIFYIWNIKCRLITKLITDHVCKLRDESNETN